MADVMLGDKLMKGIKNITREVEKPHNVGV